MNGSSYRIAYDRLKSLLRRAESAEDIEALERARGEMDAFVATLVTDPRRLRALAGVSPGAAAEVERLAAEIDIPRMVLDPVHDASFTRLWVATLDDARLRVLQRVMADEVSRRREDSVAETYAPRRRPVAQYARGFG
ncbi:hypothetical protein [Roseomonas sp. CECT 9278]|uniref:hypothetical protein n=1 Tax=Roseomonas sp. CECT 9278 TaxID=2845823 RepID=UPI001E4F92C1|nr:hypothetical protein [Roseomonas sp. CECT 9278]CAH0241777.1 hypothetical protein ROS9278_02911 [Roseomonas sp. CECT 9278]